jgi:hypothetical protein
MGLFKNKQLIKQLAFIALLLPHIVAQAEQTYFQINGVSVHSKSGYNGFNPGLGLEREVSENWNIAGGWYYNSNYRGSAYAYGRYSYYRQSGWDLGISIGAATGYDSWAVMPIAFPEFCYEWLCAIAFPQVESTGASILAIHARIPL